MADRLAIVTPTFNRRVDLCECLDSILASTVVPDRVIVSDDCSTDDTVEWVRAHYPSVEVVVAARNSGVSSARNAGAARALTDCDLILFIDSDATLAPDAIGHLLQAMQAHRDAGMCGPKIYYHDPANRIWWAGATISLVTGRTKYRGDEDDAGQYEVSIKTGHIPTVFMVRREVFERIGGFDPTYFIIFDESDFAERAIQSGFSIYYVPKARAWHKLSFSGFSDADQRAQQTLGVRNPDRAYLISRNRILYMRKLAGFGGRIAFFTVFMPLLTAYYVIRSGLIGRWDIAAGALRGVVDGLRFKPGERFVRLPSVDGGFATTGPDPSARQQA